MILGLIALALTPVAPMAESGVRPLRPSSIELAHVLNRTEASRMDEAAAFDTVLALLTSQRFARFGAPCEIEVPDCLSAARVAAQEIAPLWRAKISETGDQWLAVFIEEAMSEADVRSTLAFLNQPAGRGLLELFDRLKNLGKLASPEATARIKEVVHYEGMEKVAPAAIDRFFKTTASLPRRRFAAPVPPVE